MDVVLVSLVVIGVGAFVVWKYLLQENQDRMPRHAQDPYDDVLMDIDEHESEAQTEFHQRGNRFIRRAKPVKESLLKENLFIERKFVNRLRKEPVNEATQQELLFEDPMQPAAIIGEEKIILLYIKAQLGLPFAGNALAKVLADEGFVFGELQLYHLMSHTRQPVISIANAVEPGLFDVKKMGDQTFPALAVFLRLPGPMPAVGAFDLMLQKTHNIAKALRGSMLDGSHSTLTQQTIAHLRGQMIEYEHKVQIAAARMHA